MSPRQKAFTLIELLVVISIIALLSSVVVASLNSARDKARLAAAKQFSSHLGRVAGDAAAAIWEFDECTGTSVSDRSGNWATATTSGSPGWSSDTPHPSGCSLSLNGSTQYVNLPEIPYSETRTFSVWVKPSSESNKAGVFGNDNNVLMNYSYQVCGGIVLINGQAFGTIYSAGAYQSVSAPLSMGQWHHLALVRDVEAQKIALYLDGRLVGQASFSVASLGVVSGVNQCNSNLAKIGRFSSTNSSGPNGYLAGLVDQASVFSKALTASDVRAVYASGLERLKLAGGREGRAAEASNIDF